LISNSGKIGKFHGRRFFWDAFFFRYGANPKLIFELPNLLPSEMLRIICEEFEKSDILWVGDNDFDGSFGLATVLSMLGIPYILSLKETRMYYSEFERTAIEKAIKVIVPHEGYVELFKQKYGIDLSAKTIYADIDWRSKVVYDKLSKVKVKKISEYDGRLHICILSDRAIWDKNETRSQGRYYYVDIIKDLLKAGFVVHLHTKTLIKSLNEPVFYENNPYFELTKLFQNSFFIEKPINLLRPEGYLELMKYDLGLLTSGATTDPEFMKFEQYNIPNRYYEYQMAGVVPIAPKGVLKYMEKTCDDVIFFEKPEDIFSQINKIGPVKPKNFFSEIVDIIIESI
jgi:hypothetical protein